MVRMARPFAMITPFYIYNTFVYEIVIIWKQYNIIAIAIVIRISFCHSSFSTIQVDVGASNSCSVLKKLDNFYT